MHWAKTCLDRSNYNVVHVAESLSKTEYKAVCDEEAIDQ